MEAEGEITDTLDNIIRDNTDKILAECEENMKKGDEALDVYDYEKAEECYSLIKPNEDKLSKESKIKLYEKLSYTYYSLLKYKEATEAANFLYNYDKGNKNALKTILNILLDIGEFIRFNQLKKKIEEKFSKNEETLHFFEEVFKKFEEKEEAKQALEEYKENKEKSEKKYDLLRNIIKFSLAAVPAGLIGVGIMLLGTTIKKGIFKG